MMPIEIRKGAVLNERAIIPAKIGPKFAKHQAKPIRTAEIVLGL